MARRSRPRSAPQPSVPPAAIVGAAVVLVAAGAMFAGASRGKRIMQASVEAASRQAPAQSKQAERRAQQQRHAQALERWAAELGKERDTGSALLGQLEPLMPKASTRESFLGRMGHDRAMDDVDRELRSIEQRRSPDQALTSDARSIDNFERECQQLLARLTRANQELRELIDGLRAKK